jgi:hypothetical protein
LDIEAQNGADSRIQTVPDPAGTAMRTVESRSARLVYKDRELAKMLQKPETLRPVSDMLEEPDRPRPVWELPQGWSPSPIRPSPERKMPDSIGVIISKIPSLNLSKSEADIIPDCVPRRFIFQQFGRQRLTAAYVNPLTFSYAATTTSYSFQQFHLKIMGHCLQRRIHCIIMLRVVRRTVYSKNPST